MQTYQCCNPNCGNILTPQGPIVALVNHQTSAIEHPVLFLEDGFLAKSTLEAINNLFDNPEKHKSITISSDQKISGSLGGFNIGHIEIGVPKRSLNLAAQQSITLCCSVCGICCDYNN
ncbi:hypothetical protein PQ469_30755 [Mucilaginibacter sp. KACC 22773]|uniref:hypothetical protein n=1 Tax=Mucilaginibacter sp. KACC 22773 TaxID=3025671 RepID=UPI0023651D14|nr:hypothetical protein [Mucilaginibacter sp. KACC 22773]WDF78270.1 hypothetical protein PQ469_30755 [Mucilaginibacter sp. KACC 22773]